MRFTLLILSLLALTFTFPLTSAAQWKSFETLTSNGESLSPRQDHALFGFAGSLWIHGGDLGDGKQTGELYKYSEKTKIMQEMTKSPLKVAGHAYAIVENTYYCWGGNGDAGVLNSLMTYDFISNSWFDLTPHIKKENNIVGRSGSNGFSYNGHFYVFGGTDEKLHFSGDLYQFNYRTNTFHKIGFTSPTSPEPRTRAVLVIQGSTVFLQGGFNGKMLDDTWTLDMESLKWTQITPTYGKISKRWGHAATLVQDNVFIFGGNTIEDSTGGEKGTVNDQFSYSLKSKSYYEIPVVQTGNAVPTPRLLPSMTTVINADQTISVFLFGGGVPNTEANGRFGDLWILTDAQQGLKATNCYDYCNVNLLACPYPYASFSDLTQCLSVCRTLRDADIRQFDSKNTLQCRMEQAMQALDKKQTVGTVDENACKASSPTGNGVCGTMCDSYCDQMQAVCNTVYNKIYTSRAVCLEICPSMTVNTNSVPFMVNGTDSLNCRIYQAFSANQNPKQYCPMASKDSTVCKESLVAPDTNEWQGGGPIEPVQVDGIGIGDIKLVPSVIPRTGSFKVDVSYLTTTEGVNGIIDVIDSAGISYGQGIISTPITKIKVSIAVTLTKPIPSSILSVALKFSLVNANNVKIATSEINVLVGDKVVYGPYTPPPPVKPIVSSTATKPITRISSTGGVKPTPLPVDVEPTPVIVDQPTATGPVEPTTTTTTPPVQERAVETSDSLPTLPSLISAGIVLVGGTVAALVL